MDGFIDEIITTTIYDPSWVDRIKNPALLVIHTIFRTLQPLETLKRDEPLSLRKIPGEGQFEELKKFLSWEIQVCSLGVLLPKEKETDWLHRTSGNPYPQQK